MRKFTADEIDLIIRYGSPSSEAMLDFPCYIFQIPDGIGMIAYRIEFQCAIVFGDPICPENELINISEAFLKYCNEAHLHIIYIIVSEKFAKLLQDYFPISIEVCEELIFDPQMDISSKSNRLKHRLNNAIKRGLTFHEYTPFDEKIEKSLLDIGMSWQKAKKEKTLHLGHLNFFETRKGKRWFYVKDGEVITSMAMLSRYDAKDGWLLKFFFTLPNVFHETSEFLMISLLDTLKHENCNFLSKGMVPIDSINKLKGFKYGAFFIKSTYNLIGGLFKFKKHKQYWERYFPKKIPSYILFSNSRIGLREIRALIKVINLK